MGKFSINNNVAAKTLECTVQGIMSIQDAAGFIDQYKRSIATITPSQYALTFDCTKLGLSSKECQDKLAECFLLYKQAHFKQITFKTGNNSILMMQLTRLAHTVQLQNYKVE